MRIKDWQVIFKRFKKLIDALPTAEEKRQLSKSINEIVSFFTELNTVFQNLPTKEEAEKAKNALDKFENILQRNPLLKEVLSPKKQASKSAKKRSTKQKKVIEFPDEQLENEIQYFLTLSEEKLRSTLTQEKKYTNNYLSALLGKLGWRVPKKATKKELIDQIVTTIVNLRTYRGLRNL